MTEAELVEADEKAKAAAIAATGRAWSERRPYTDPEDEAIISYIDAKGVQSETGGVKLWRRMEEEAVVPGRTGESMKKRYRRIKRNEQSSSSGSGDKKEEEIPAKGRGAAYTTEEDHKILRYLARNKEFDRVGSPSLWRKMEEEEIVEDRSWKSMMHRYRLIMKNVEPSSLVGKSEEEILAMADSGQASSRRWGYTSEEEERMLRYITSKNEYYRVGSDALWQQMKEEKVLESRSWPSMKEHFNKIIMSNLGEFPFLSDQERSFLRERTVVKDKEGKVAAGQMRAGQPYTKDEDNAMLSFIAANPGYGKPGGDKLWKKMQEEKLLDGRTWSSMQMHYLKTMKNKKTSSVEDKEGETEEEEEEMDVGEREMEENEEEVDDVGEQVDEVVPTCIIVDF